MTEAHFYELEITPDNYFILSADPEFYNVINSEINSSFADFIDPAYREMTIAGLCASEDIWVPVRILTNTGYRLFCARASRSKKTNNIKLVIVSMEELIDSQIYLKDALTTLKTQLSIYEDIFFDYDPIEKVVALANTQIADFDAGFYTLSAVEAILCKKVNAEDQEKIKSFITQVKSKTGRFSTRIEANLINGDTSITSTTLEASYVFYRNGKERVLGHMHPNSASGSVQMNLLKRDSLTGLVDKADITRIAQERINARKQTGTTLAVIDIDFFKKVNDTFGHQFGDTVIKRIADIISSVVGTNGIAGRFGGDEFLVVFYKITNEPTLRNYFKTMRKSIKAAFDDSSVDSRTPLTISIGAACFDDASYSYEDVFMLADHCLYIAKEKGRNRYVIYTEEKHGSLEDIKQQEMTKKKINERGDLSLGDIIVKMFDVALYQEGVTPEQLMDEFVQNFDIQRMMLLVGKPFTRRYTTGTDKINKEYTPQMLLEVLNSDNKEKFLAGRNFIVVDKIDHLPPQAGPIKEFLKKINVYSFVVLRFHDKDGRECILIFSSIGKYLQWNEMHFKYYRAFSDLLSRFSLGQ